MGLHVDVYRFPLGECTRNGISSRAAGLCLVNVEGPSRPTADAPAALLIKGHLRGMVRIVPAVKLHPEDSEWQPDPRWCMMGGNYAATSDSRFFRAIEVITGAPAYGAVPIHDRIES